MGRRDPVLLVTGTLAMQSTPELTTPAGRPRPPAVPPAGDAEGVESWSQNLAVAPVAALLSQPSPTHPPPVGGRLAPSPSTHRPPCPGGPLQG